MDGCRWQLHRRSGFATRRGIDHLLTTQAALLSQGQRVDERLLSLHLGQRKENMCGGGAGLEHVTAVFGGHIVSFTPFSPQSLLSG